MRKVAGRVLFAMLFSFIGMSALPQATGDYRSAANGNWNVAGTWERYDGANWVAAATPPSSSDGVITIRNPHNVTVVSAITVDQVIIDIGGAITTTNLASLALNDATGNEITVNGTFDFAGGSLSGTGSI